MQVAAGILVALACVFIWRGRVNVRRARRLLLAQAEMGGSLGGGGAARTRRAWGWLLVGVGFLLMIAGVVLW